MKNSNLNKKNKFFKKKKILKLIHIFSNQSKITGDLNAACFYATQAYVLSLEYNYSISIIKYSY